MPCGCSKGERGGHRHSMMTDADQQGGRNKARGARIGLPLPTHGPIVGANSDNEAQMSSIEYARIERAIHYLTAHAAGQPRLRDVAAHVGLSEYHFQRLFRRWAGVSPKRFVQFLTAQQAVHRLNGATSVLQVTFELGLSSPSRLHDLLVNVEAVTPGEAGSGGAGVQVRWGHHPTPFGDCVIGATER